MTIKKKIRLSNIMMVLIPILFTTIVFIVCLNTEYDLQLSTGIMGEQLGALSRNGGADTYLVQ